MFNQKSRDSIWNWIGVYFIYVFVSRLFVLVFFLLQRFLGLVSLRSRCHNLISFGTMHYYFMRMNRHLKTSLFSLAHLLLYQSLRTSYISYKILRTNDNGEEWGIIINSRYISISEGCETLWNHRCIRSK